jgi:HEAT repeat protein
MEESDAQLAVRCEHLLEEQREYDRTKHALTVAGVLQDMTKEMKNAPVTDVLPLLEHTEWELRYAAARALIGNREARTDAVRLALARALAADTNQYSLPDIIQAAYYTGATNATPTLCSIAVSNQFAHVRYAAVEAQYWLRDPRALNALLFATHDSATNVALRAVHVLAIIGDRTALPRLRALAFQSKGDMQIQSVQALGMMRDEQSGEQLRALLKTDNERLLQCAIWSLGQVRNGKAVPELITFLSYGHTKIQDAAFQALLEIGDAAVFDYFIARFKETPDAKLSLRAITSLYPRHMADRANRRSELKPQEIGELAELLTASLRDAEQKMHGDRVNPDHIKTVREYNGLSFISVTFADSGLEAIVLRDENGKAASAKIVGGWVE